MEKRREAKVEEVFYITYKEVVIVALAIVAGLVFGAIALIWYVNP